MGQCPTWWTPCRIEVAPCVQRRKVWLTPTTTVPCSNAAKTRYPLKYDGVHALLVVNTVTRSLKSTARSRAVRIWTIKIGFDPAADSIRIRSIKIGFDPNSLLESVRTLLITRSTHHRVNSLQSSYYTVSSSHGQLLIIRHITKIWKKLRKLCLIRAIF